MGTRELQVEWDCLVLLNKQGWYAWKNHTTGIFDEASGSFRKGSVFHIAGASDIIAVKGGIVIFVEVKADGGVQNKDQINFEKQITKRGGYYILARSVAELEKNLHRVLGHR